MNEEISNLFKSCFTWVELTLTKNWCKKNNPAWYKCLNDTVTKKLWITGQYHKLFFSLKYNLIFSKIWNNINMFVVYAQHLKQECTPGKTLNAVFSRGSPFKNSCSKALPHIVSFLSFNNEFIFGILKSWSESSFSF